MVLGRFDDQPVDPLKGVEKGAAEGAVREAGRLLLLQGRKRFGLLTPSVEATLQGITDPARLDRITEHIFVATGWDDPLATPVKTDGA
jgi:hypothetical protein